MAFPSGTCTAADASNMDGAAEAWDPHLFILLLLSYFNENISFSFFFFYMSLTSHRSYLICIIKFGNKSMDSNSHREYSSL